jgi:adenosylhomocysteine nucleosidase
MATPAAARQPSPECTRRLPEVAVKILVTFALENEFAPWRDARGFRAQPRAQGEIDGPETFTAEIAGARVEVVLTGAGPKPAASAISQVIQAAPGSIDFCISSGLAGALRPDYRVGQVLAARAVRSGTPVAGENETIQSSGALISFACECGATPVDKFHTAGRVIGRAAEKKHLGESADAVEMESFVVLGEARRRGVPAIAVRAVSDTADEDLPFDMTGIFTAEGRISMPLVLAQMAKHPQSISAVMKLGQSAKAAATELAAFLDCYVERLAAAGTGLEGQAASAKFS